MEDYSTLLIVFLSIAITLAVVTLCIVFVLSIQIISFLIIKRRFDKMGDAELKRVEKELFGEDSEWKRSS